ncbi:MAG: hypothetical protein KGJ41_02810 [Rhodospirillales bacterium]|nr:hypothetical protein [Rhodospirillales bacterium]MDE2197927.1 hypothetical protein [Rhodospirillales bacterium]MDE2574001.1 hypothetical protein [Rhodospirillales bacterium]
MAEGKLPAAGKLPADHAGADADTLARRRRGRNIAMLVVLLAVAALFYAVAMVKLGHPDLGR